MALGSVPDDFEAQDDEASWIDPVFVWPELKKLAESARDYWKRKTLSDALFVGSSFEAMTADDVKALAKAVGRIGEPKSFQELSPGQMA